MIDYLLLSTAALLLTTVIEVGIAWLCRLRSKRELGTVVLINVITNPLLNYLLAVNGYFHLVSQTFVLILCLEAGVVLVEWRLLVYVLRRGETGMLALSIGINACSFLAGLLIFW
jgi:hypothetical protein